MAGQRLRTAVLQAGVPVPAATMSRSRHRPRSVANLQSPAQLFRAFLERPSAALATRALQDEDDPIRGWAIFRHVLDAGFSVKAPFFQRMMVLCLRCLPGRAPNVLRTAVSNGVPVRHDEPLFCTFLGACKAANPPLVEDCLELYTKYGPRSHNVIFGVAHICRAFNRPASALFLLSDIIDNGIDLSESMMFLFASCCAESGSSMAADTAVKLLELIRFRGTLSSQHQTLLTLLVKTLLLQRRLDSVVDAVNVMESVGVSACNETYGIVLAALLKADRIHDATAVFCVMAERRITLDAPLLTLLIAGCGRHCFASPLPALHAYASQNAMLENDFVVSALIYAFDRCDQLDNAEQVFSALLDAAQPDVATFNAMISAYVRHGRITQAVETFKKLEAIRLTPSIQTLTTMAFALAKNDRVPEALVVFKQMVELGVLVDTPLFGFLLSASARCRNEPGVRILEQYAVDSGISLEDTVCSALIAALSRCGRLRDAERLFQTRTGSSSSCAPSVETFNAMIAAYARQGMLLEAVSVFGQLKGAGVRPSMQTYTTIVNAFSVDDNGGAREPLAPFYEILRQGIHVDASMLGCFIASCARYSDLPAIRVLHSYAREHSFLDSDDVVKTFASAYTHCGRLVAAEQPYCPGSGSSSSPTDAALLGFMNCFNRPHDTTFGGSRHPLVMMPSTIRIRSRPRASSLL
ncbi:Pentacotripeptide-repeat region of PRORP domain-containing protein [Plasmodiophora brassicae]|uniref:Pentacotripeptide-repeat region of PRORP domain-containing protein n=1 Tax=Plasmodiophora brassicae TaxID=37360 RepID=A0A0G4J779_PLABS|nr:hypothetical protein PBRA_003142 [Plasmodiophora brassicae]